MNAKSLLLCSLALILTLPSAAARPRSVDCRLLQLERSRTTPGTLFAPDKTGKNFEQAKLSFSVDTRPTGLFVPESGTIEFRADADASSPVIATATIPPSAKEPYLFFIKDHNPDDNLVYQIAVVEAPSKALAKSGALFHNATTSPGKVTLGSETVALPPAETLLLPAPKNRDEYNIASLKIEFETDGKWSTLTNTRPRFSSRDYHFFIAYPATPDGRSKVKTYRKSLSVPTSGR